MPTSRAKPDQARQQRLKNPPLEQEREWIPLWLAGPVVALVAMLGLLGLVLMAVEAYAWLW